VFILYAIPIGIVAGYLAGGRLERLGALRLRWAPLALLGLAIQVLIFSDPVGSLVGDAGPAVYVASTAIVLIVVLRNIAIPGVGLIAIGATCNLAAIVANGGWMPADGSALASVGGLPAGASNSIVVADPALGPLTDLFALPAALPLANVFSVGDVLIGAGVAVTIALAMRAASPAGKRSTSGVAAGPDPLD
jgi:uncharacterized protein DUF5317